MCIVNKSRRATYSTRIAGTNAISLIIPTVVISIVMRITMLISTMDIALVPAVPLN